MLLFDTICTHCSITNRVGSSCFADRSKKYFATLSQNYFHKKCTTETGRNLLLTKSITMVWNNEEKIKLTALIKNLAPFQTLRRDERTPCLLDLGLITPLVSKKYKYVQNLQNCIKKYIFRLRTLLYST